MPAIESVSFDTAGMTTLPEPPTGQRAWLTSDRDGIFLNYFSKPPDIGANLTSLDALRAFYRKGVSAVGGAILEVDALRIAGFDAVRMILKLPQKPRGMTYLGSLTLPFRDFSFVIKAQCMEHGVTGLRDSVILDAELRAGNVVPDRNSGQMKGWCRDPYDPTIHTVLMRNLSEDVVYDKQFPDHTLSRCRNLLRRLHGP